MTALSIQQALVYLIIFVGTVGLIASNRAKRSLAKQIKLFSKNTNPLERNITSDTPPEKHAEEVEIKLKELRKAKKISGKDHLSQRLEPMIHISKQVGSKLRLPSLDDLHELSLEYEHSKKSVCLQSSVQATVLILGICGTLWGVHTGIEGEEFSPDELKTALQPGIAAVVCTILLTIGKGLYTRTLDVYMSILDRYTLDTLVPCMQPVGAYDEKMEEMAQPIENLREGIHVLNAATQRLNVSVDTLIDTSRSITAADTDMCEVYKFMQLTAKDIESNALQAVARSQAAERYRDELSEKYKRLIPCAKNLRELHNNIILRMQTTTELLSKNPETLKESAEASYMKLLPLREHMMNESELSASVNSIYRKQQKILSAIAEQETELLTKMQKMQASWEELKNKEKQTDSHLENLLPELLSTNDRVEATRKNTEEYKRLRDNTISDYTELVKLSIKTIRHYPKKAKNYLKLVDNRIQEYGKKRTFLTLVEIILLIIFLLMAWTRVIAPIMNDEF